MKNSYNFKTYHIPYQNLMMSIMIFSLVAVLPSCSKNNSGPAKGTTSFEVTDAPIDDVNVSGAFVTISEIDVDGKPIQGYQKTTVNLMAYQSGKTKLLNSLSMEAKSYSNVSLVLDYDTDAAGNSPGCYLQMANNTKEKLTSSTNTFTMNHSFDLSQSSNANLVFDFDLRKAVVRHETSTDTSYNFVTASEMQNSIRVVSKAKTGNIKGTCHDTSSGSDEIIVYAYAKGTYSSSETNAQGTSGVRFAHAVTSAKVMSDGSYTLAFLNSGNYELHYASYKKNSSGEMVFNGMLSVSVIGTIDLGSIKVNANTATTVNINVTGLLPVAHQ